MTNESSEERVVVREVDRRTAVRLRALEVAAEKAKYKAAVSKSRAEAKDAAAAQRFQAKMELAKIKATQSATEKARSGIAQASPWMVCFLVGGFVIALSTGSIPAEATATSSALITLVMTGLLANLRSIISESNGNGHDEDEDKDTPKPKQKKE